MNKHKIEFEIISLSSSFIEINTLINFSGLLYSGKFFHLGKALKHSKQLKLISADETNKGGLHPHLGGKKSGL